MMKALVLLAAFPALAETTPLDVRANIRGACRIESIQPLDFGELGPGAADRTASGAVKFWCTHGLQYEITLGPGNSLAGDVRRMVDRAAGGEPGFLPYSLASGSPVTGIGRGPTAPETHVLRGMVKGSDYSVLRQGGYRDTVVVSVTAPACCAASGTVDSVAVKH